MERAYSTVYDLCDGNELTINLVAGIAILSTFYWLVNLAFIVIDATNPSFVQPFKIQENKQPTLLKYVSALKLICFNQYIVGPCTTFVFYHIGKYTGVTYGKDLPDVLTIIKHLFFCVFVEEIGFYYSHRLFHHPSIYRHFHKIHHEWTTPVSITSIYCHPVEHALSNLTPVLLGPTLCGAHISTVWIWSAIAILSTTFSHSGYHFPFQPSSEAHDYHHKVFNECFGVLGILDYLHGTNPTFRKSVNYKRHHTYLSFKPIKETYPENPRTK